MMRRGRGFDNGWRAGHLRGRARGAGAIHGATAKPVRDLPLKNVRLV